MAGTYSVDQIVGKSLRFARTGTVHVSGPYSTTTLLYKPGSFFPVDFWLERPDGLYWGKYGNKPGEGLYVKHEQGLFYPPSDAKTTDEIQKQKDDEGKAWYEKLAENFGKGAKEVAIAAVVVYGVYKIAT